MVQRYSANMDFPDGFSAQVRIDALNDFVLAHHQLGF
jgi:hypothetical protein